MSYPKPKKRKVSKPIVKRAGPSPAIVVKKVEKKGLTDSGKNPYNGGSIFDASPTKYSKKPMYPAGTKKK